MKFVCDRCQTKYSIADERVRGKVLKVKCKTCANLITVREARAPSSAGLPTLSAGGAARPGTRGAACGQRRQTGRRGRTGLANRDEVRAGLTLDLEDLPANPFVRDGVLGLTAIADEFHSI